MNSSSRTSSGTGRSHSDSATVSDAAAVIADTPVVVFSKSYCPYCRQAKATLESLGVHYAVVELDQVEGGRQMQREVAGIVGRSSVPAVFVGGNYVGGANDGGLGGVVPLARAGKLQGMLREAGAL
uniref:Glutaredoxin domain-containing protein n=1 Tax=Phaeomonas parva TaxID=124430 RepID=A0A6U4LD94_9STRA|mmetsp:Transcript_6681/g.19093  ORF Transcript_6681/g.19093 Transcript_6681/m.19093 type:complete len:126 (+) Transcript_6681:230-607(+)